MKARQILAIVLFACSLSASATSFHLFITGDVQGLISCDQSESHGDLLSIEKTLAAERAALADEATLVLDTGDVLAYHYLARVDSGRTVFSLLQRAGYDAGVVGNLDFSYGHEMLHHFARQPQRPRLLAANLFLNDSTYLPPFSVIEKQGVRFGVIGLIDPSYRQTVAAQNLGKLTLAEPAKVVQNLADSLRMQCDILVALTHLETSKCLELAHKITGIDVWIAKPGSLTDYLYQVSAQNGELRGVVITAPVKAMHIGRLSGALDQSGRLQDVQYQSLALQQAEDAQSSEIYRRLDQEYIARFQHQWGFSPDEPLISQDKPIPEDEVVRSLLAVLLQRMRAEIAIINRGFFRFDATDLQNTLTARDIDKIFWSYDQVALVQMSGKQIKALNAQSKTYARDVREHLYALSMQSSDKGLSADWKINSRDFQNDEPYRVATSKFLAEGGDNYGIFTTSQRKMRFTGTYPLKADESVGKEWSISGLYLTELVPLKKHGETIDLSDWVTNHPSLNRPLWRLKIDRLDLGLKKIAIANHTRLTGAKESRIKSTTRGADSFAAHAILRLLRESSKMRWENSGTYRYDLTRIAAQGDLASLSTLETNIEFESVMDFHLTRSRAHNPFASLRFDTNHKFIQQDLYASVGYSSIGKNNNTLRLGFLAKTDLVKSVTNSGFEMTARLRIPIANFYLDPQVRSRYLFSNSTTLADDERFSFELTEGIQVPLTQNIKLTPRLDVFVYLPHGHSAYARNVQYSVNLRFARDWKFQYQRW
ncbi:MAG TPA: 5'-nucleotidase C-terminal domain-containing protein [bacterium]|nr:5'-nucleotidase C-terminal domain-containing protein [bacterium]HOX85114.1 5'-nucleotidase C-terminal domain-containing protein [bacterium]HPG47037.1 5'-nucleotidase C-terminal domain-containing protein [bacterium]HPM99375.1 5'-nucleotidase C-terminal domain-containing protein [bacterium]